MRTRVLKAAAGAAGATLLLAASAQAVQIVADGFSGATGTTGVFGVMLSAAGEPVGATQNDIIYGADSEVAVPATADGMPDCSVNPAIHKDGATFEFLPAGCTAGTDCTGIRALVRSLDNGAPIPEGSQLYTCKVTIAADASPGERTLLNTSAGAIDPHDVGLPTAGVNGRVVVTSVIIKVGNAAGMPDETVNVDISLETNTEVAGVINEIAFGADSGVAVSNRLNGTPDCRVNVDIEKGGTSFAFRPPGCTPGADCSGIKALVYTDDNTLPIPNGSVLYTCRVHISAEATPGDYPLTCFNAGAAAPDGGELAPACGNGTVTVVGQISPSITPTPTGTPDRTSTPSFAPTVSGGGGGCAVAAPAQKSGAWLLLLPAAALVRRRRRVR